MTTMQRGLRLPGAKPDDPSNRNSHTNNSCGTRPAPAGPAALLTLRHCHNHPQFPLDCVESLTRRSSLARTVEKNDMPVQFCRYSFGKFTNYVRGVSAGADFLDDH